MAKAFLAVVFVTFVYVFVCICIVENKIFFYYAAQHLFSTVGRYTLCSKKVTPKFKSL